MTSKGRRKLPDGKARTKTLQVRLTVEERSKLEQKAKNDGLTPSSWGRKIVLERLGE